MFFFAQDRCFKMCTCSRFTSKISRFCWKLCQILEAFAKTSPLLFFPFSDQPFLLLGKTFQAWQWSVYLQRPGRDRWCLGKPSRFGVSAPSAVLVGAIAPWPRWQWTKHWLFRAYRGGIYYPVTWGSLWNNQDSMESKGPRVFLLSPTSTLVWGVCWLEGPPEIMGIPEGANPPSMPLKLRKHDWPLKQPMERSGDFDGW